MSVRVLQDNLVLLTELIMKTDYYKEVLKLMFQGLSFVMANGRILICVFYMMKRKYMYPLLLKSPISSTEKYYENNGWPVLLCLTTLIRLLIQNTRI